MSEYSKDGKFKDRIGNILLGKNAMDPSDLAVDEEGRIYAMDTLFCNRVVVFERRRFMF